MGAQLPRDRDHLVEPFLAGLQPEEVPPEPAPDPGRRARARALWGVLAIGLLAAGYLFWA